MNFTAENSANIFRSLASQRHVTRQMILNWRKSLRFPATPRISHEGVNLIQQLLCEPEDRLGSQSPSSAMRPNSIVTQARMSGFSSTFSGGPSVDGAEKIKVRPSRRRHID